MVFMEPRMQWKGRLEFLFTSFGYVVGLGNLWRFPYTCYLNGGGVYVIPYLLTVVLLVLPMMLLEMGLGQFVSQGVVNVWRICPLAAGIGWAVLFNTLIVTIYYVVILMYAFYYMLVAFVNIGGPLPWQNCQHAWNTEKCRAETYPDFDVMTESQQTTVMLSMMEPACVDRHKQLMSLGWASSAGLSLETLKNNFTTCLIQYASPEEEYWNRFVLGSYESDGVDDLGEVVGRNAVLLLVVWLIVYFSCVRGIRSIAKVIYVTATFPFGLYIVLLVRGVTLSGHVEGIRYFTQPDWSKLGDLTIWSSAAMQALFSTGNVFGGYIALASFNKFNYNILRDTIIITCFDTFTSIFGGFIVFGFLGHASYVLNKPIDQIFDDNGPGLLFISYIQGNSQMPGAAVWAFLFFLTVFTLGLDSAFVMFWTLLVSIEDLIPRIFKRFKVLIPLGACTVAFLLGLPMVTKGGIHMVVLVDQYSSNLTLIIILICKMLSVCLLYGVNNFIYDIEMMIGKKSVYFWWFLKAAWMVFIPIFSVFIFISLIVSYQKSSYMGIQLTRGGEAIGWFLILTPIFILVGVALFQIRRYGGIRHACAPSPQWHPRDPADCQGRYGTYITPTNDSNGPGYTFTSDANEFYITPCGEQREEDNPVLPEPHGNDTSWI